MRQIIRQNTFETNSSSMHSLVVMGDRQIHNINVVNDIVSSAEGWGKFNMFNNWDPDEYMFERAPFRILFSPMDKLRYYTAYYVGTEGNESKKKEIIEFIKQQTNLTEDKISLTANEDDDYGKYGYVKCNDTGEDPMHYLESHNISMEDFILNPKYIVVIDGDEYRILEYMIHSGLINIDELEDISSGKDFWDNRVGKYYFNWFSDIEWVSEELGNLNKYNKIIIEETGDEYEDIENMIANLKLLCENVKDINIHILTNNKDLFKSLGYQNVIIEPYNREAI